MSLGSFVLVGHARRTIGGLAVTCALAAAPAAAQTPQTGADRPAPPPRLAARVEFRERMESIRAAGFTNDRNDVFWLSRLRASVSLRPAAWLGMTIQVQDGRVAGKDVGPAGTPFSAPINVRLAHLELGGPSSPVTVTAGRQELAFGEQRLVGHVSWANAARVFDAVRITARRRGLQVDGFLSSVVRVRTDDWDRGGFGNRFHGIYASSARVVPHATIEPYFLWRADTDQPTETGGPARLRLGTLGVRLAGHLPGGTDYGLETVMQRGSTGPDRHRARAQHLRIRSPLIGPGLRTVAEYNYASGDNTPGDGTRGTFDPLYPTPHDKYGLADQIGWRNMHHARVALNVTAAGRLPGGVSLMVACQPEGCAIQRDRGGRRALGAGCLEHARGTGIRRGGVAHFLAAPGCLRRLRGHPAGGLSARGDARRPVSQCLPDGDRHTDRTSLNRARPSPGPSSPLRQGPRRPVPHRPVGSEPHRRDRSRRSWRNAQ